MPRPPRKKRYVLGASARARPALHALPRVAPVPVPTSRQYTEVLAWTAGPRADLAAVLIPKPVRVPQLFTQRLDAQLRRQVVVATPLRYTQRLSVPLVARVALGSLTAQHQINFIWNANVEPAVTGYTLHVGRVSNVYPAPTQVDVGFVTATSYSVPVGSGTWYFSLTAYTDVDISGFATEVSTTV